MDEDGGWVRVASTEDVAEDSVLAVSVGNYDIAIYNLGGCEFRATDNVCTHEYAQLSEGWLEDGIIECPLHAGRFDVRTGKGLCAPIVQDLPIMEVQVRDGDVLVKLPR